MIYLALVVLLWVALQTLVALSNYLFRVDYTRFSTREQALLSVIIPARNEEDNIANLLDDLHEQAYRNLQIIVVDDNSTDKTAEIIAACAVRDKRIQSYRLDDEPSDAWLGKNRACFEAAKYAQGRYLLFLDADVRIGNNALESILGYFCKEKLSFLSVFPKQVLNKKTVYVTPIMNYVLLSFLPLFLVRRSGFSSLSAANGQFMFFDTQAYRAFEPHRLFRSEKAEDIKIARFMKAKAFRIACLLGRDGISCMMYRSYKEAIAGFSKNIVAFFGNSFFIAILAWSLTFFGALIMLVAAPLHWVLAYFLMLLLNIACVSSASEQPVGRNILLYYVQMYNMGLLIFKSLRFKITKNYRWKERNISY